MTTDMQKAPSVARKALTSADDATPVARYDLSTSEGGRRYIADFFATELRRHDFAGYINTRLAADFACALAQHLAATAMQQVGGVLGDASVDVTDPWRGLYQATRLPAPTEYGDIAHPDIPCWPDDREDALDKLVHAQGFDFQIVAGEFTEAALEDGDDLYWEEMRAWTPVAPPEGEWRLAWKGDTEDGPYAWFVRPMALRPDPVALAATGKQQVGEVQLGALLAEMLEDSARAAELANRLIAPGPKAAQVSASETHEISDFVLTVVDLLPVLAARLPATGGYDQSAEDRFEQFVQAEIARSPDALRELGEYLGRVLDEDEFPQANSLLLQLATEYAGPPAQGIDLGQEQDAARWRWVREQNGVTVSVEEADDDGDMTFVSGHTPEELDAAIDGQRDAAPGVAS